MTEMARQILTCFLLCLAVHACFTCAAAYDDGEDNSEQLLDDEIFEDMRASFARLVKMSTRYKPSRRPFVDDYENRPISAPVKRLGSVAGFDNLDYTATTFDQARHGPYQHRLRGNSVASNELTLRTPAVVQDISGKQPSRTRPQRTRLPTQQESSRRGSLSSSATLDLIRGLISAG